MRTSVGDMRRQNRGRGSVLRSEPTPGTRLRKLYDLFLANPVTPISIDVIYPLINNNRAKAGREFGIVRNQLAGYELDIRRYSAKRWWLVADGKRDYMGEAVAR